MANAKAKTPAVKAPAFDLAVAIGEWLGKVDGVETSTATLAAGLCKDMGLAVKADLRVFGAPKSTEEKADNFHVSGYARIYAAVEENIVVKGERITPATVAALRDMPNNMPPMMVAPLRLVPGIMAKHCTRPTLSASRPRMSSTS